MAVGVKCTDGAQAREEDAAAAPSSERLCFVEVVVGESSAEVGLGATEVGLSVALLLVSRADMVTARRGVA